MNLDLLKSSLRTLYKEKRKSLSRQEIQEKSYEINKNFIENLLPKIQEKYAGKIFSLYISDGYEVLTSNIAAHFINNRIKFSYPKITKKNFHLDFILNQPDQIFEKNQFYPSIIEPASGENIMPDILIIPLLSFDDKLSRLGMGGGFFDRTIRFLKSKKRIIVIGLAYDFQRSKSNLPTEKTDQSLDAVVLQNDIIFRDLLFI